MVKSGAKRVTALPALGLIVLFAFVLRLGWAWFVPVRPVSDAAMYDAFAREIAAGHGYAFPHGDVTVYWPVGTSALYGAFYALFGTPDWLVPLINIAMGCATVAGVYVLALRRFDRRVATIAGLMVAVWPIWIQFTTVPSSELPFVMFVVGALVAREEPRLPGWGRIVVSTALLVLAAYVRPTALPLILILPLLDNGWRSPLRAGAHLALALAVAALMLGPWAARNQHYFGKPVLVSANFGANLWMGNNPDSIGGYMGLPDVGQQTETERDEYFKERAIAFIKAHPGDFLRLCLKRLQMSFDRETIGVAWNQYALPYSYQWGMKLVSSGYWLLVFGLSAVGVVLFLRANPWRLLDPLILTGGLFAAVATVVVGNDRYHLPMMPIIAVFAALAIVQLSDRLAARR